MVKHLHNVGQMVSARGLLKRREVIVFGGNVLPFAITKVRWQNASSGGSEDDALVRGGVVSWGSG